MELTYIDYIGPQITIKTLRDHILKSKLTEEDTIFLHRYDFDKIVLEYGKTYAEPFTIPYLIITVLISEDLYNRFPENRVGVLRNDTESDRSTEPYVDTYSDIVQAFRCRSCGLIVDEAGYELDDDQQMRIGKYLQNDLYPPVTTHVNGRCCRN